VNKKVLCLPDQGCNHCYVTPDTPRYIFGEARRVRGISQYSGTTAKPNQTPEKVIVVCVYLLVSKRCFAVEEERGIIKEAKPDTFSDTFSVF
jgi:hypothetical protein